MGYIRHHAIIVTGSYDLARVRQQVEPERIRGAADELGLTTSEIIDSPMNARWSFLVAPDGSKEGWEESDWGDARRDLFVAFLEGLRDVDGGSPVDWVEVQYGDDNRETRVVRHSDELHRSTEGA